MWAPTKQITSTLGTLSGFLYTNQIGINGTVWPTVLPPVPVETDPLIGYTICPSGTTFKSQDINVNPCN
jgi:hypothetical protein